MTTRGTEDISSSGDLAVSYGLQPAPVRKPSGHMPDYSDLHGFNLPGNAEYHAAPSGIHGAESQLDRYGGDGDDSKGDGKDDGDRSDHDYRD